MMLWSLFLIGALIAVTDSAPDCPGGWSEYESTCYKYFSNHLKMYCAREFCHSFESIVASSCPAGKQPRVSLPSLTSEGEREFADTLSDGNSNDPYGAKYWIGLYKNDEGWHWDDARDVEESELNWAEGEPNNQGGNQNCAAVWFDDLTWDDRDCFTENGLPFICEFKCE